MRFDALMESIRSVVVLTDRFDHNEENMITQTTKQYIYWNLQIYVMTGIHILNHVFRNGYPEYLEHASQLCALFGGNDRIRVSFPTPSLVSWITHSGCA